ncbi:MAG: hypothetical protein KA004_12705 [Verrucomicrobiales bacterium]|nr:hypothetical protein [Verrucomicrobiales bacterium]
MRRTWKFWLGIGGLFLLGLMLGIGLGMGAVQGWVKRLAQAPPAELESLVLNDWKKKLDLSEGQVEALRPALEESTKKIVPLRDQFRREVMGVLSNLHPQVKSVLDERQRKKYEEMVGRFEKRVGKGLE